MQTIFLCFMFVVGAIFGSFLCCQARRLYLREEKKLSSRPKRSVCLHCKKTLKWYDNIPIVSWLVLRGKCRKCHQKIGYLEIISELATAVSLTAIGATINVEAAAPLEWLSFAAIILFTLTMIFLGIYDGMCGRLPVVWLIVAVVFAVVSIIPGLVNNFSIQPFLSAGLFGGIYLGLYLISRGKWVGDGDWILAFTIGLSLGHPWLSLVALSLANLSACLIMYPTAKKQKNHQIYFGPFLVLAFIITYVFRDIILLCIS